MFFQSSIRNGPIYMRLLTRLTSPTRQNRGGHAAVDHAAVDNMASLRFGPSPRPRNLTPRGTIEGGASSLVASTIAWSSLLFNSKLVGNFLFSLSSTSARSITTNCKPVTIARAIWNATPNRNCSDSERYFNDASKWPSFDGQTRIWN